MDIFWFKKVVSLFLHPIPVVLVMLVLGWLILTWTRWRRRRLVPEGADVLEDYTVSKKKRRPGCLGMVLVFGAILVLYFCSIGLVSNKMLFALERQYPPLTLEEGEIGKLDPEYIVILAGSYVYKPRRPITSRFGKASTARMMEGLRVHRAYPNAKVVMTGGVMSEGWPSIASEMRDLAELLGLESEVILEEESRDTKDHARLLKTLLQDKQFIIVTSGYHMPRAMGLFRGQGLKPVAASAEIYRWPESKYNHDQLIPSSGNLSRVRMAMHEYMGLVWAFFCGQLGSEPPEEKPETEKEEEHSADEGEVLVGIQAGRESIAISIGEAINNPALFRYVASRLRHDIRRYQDRS